MSILGRYIAKQVFLSVLLVLMVILGIDVLAETIDSVGDLKGDFTFWVALQCALLKIPSTVYSVLPFVVLIGCLLGLGAIANHSELTVMQSAGVSRPRIMWMVFGPVLFISLLGFLISEYVSPITERIAETKRVTAMYGKSLPKTEHGFWHREANSFVNVAAVTPTDELLGIHIYVFNPHFELTREISAERATFNHSDEQTNWQLHNVNVTDFVSQQIIGVQKEQMLWHTELTPELLSLIALEADKLSLRGLWQYFNYLRSQNLSSADYELAFWAKLLQPAAILSLVLIAISFVFGSLREVTMGFRIFVGVLIGIVFRTTQEILGPASLVYGFAPIIAVLLPILICTIIGFYMLRRG